MASVQIRTAIPGPRSLQVLERRKQVVAGGISVGKVPVCAASANGALVTDLDGNVFIDFTGGIGCLNAGHSAPRVVAAVQKQVQAYQHLCFQVTMYEPYVALLEKLVTLTPGAFPKKGALFNSGAEAVENAVKIARRATGRQSIVCFEHGFHGRTLLGMTLTSKVKPYKEGFGPMASEVYKAPLPYLFRRPKGMTEDAFVDEAIRDLHRFFRATITPDRTAAVILEPVLGEGGFIVPPKRFVKEIERICRDHGIVLIADEIQSGFGRTGRMFASTHFDLVPDLVTMAKSMSSGFPVSAVVGRASLMDAVQPGGLGGTFCGNPVACVAALASIETIEQEGLCARADEIGERCREALSALAESHACIGEVRGLGAMLALEIVDAAGEPAKLRAEEIVVRCGRNGLLILTAGVEGNIIRFLMPLCITDEQLDEALGILARAMED